MLSSSAGWAPGPPLGVYAATKAGVDGFVAALRREVTAQGIRVHSIHPGPVRTEFIARAEGPATTCSSATPRIPRRMTASGG